ncbi:hypothetical protein IAQ61_006824 [Plenodomus lingam]|uniref:uncharacterized protein n=1 Tax=Leptosphaeria maculans TaxID=5022 RepID=UPI00332910AE|nr:hypothetical protein IAQ61_006824 [Plenodomus lingam]
MAQWPNEQTIGISDPSFAPSSDLRLSLGSPAVLHWSPLTAHTGICLVMLMMMMLMMMPGWTLNGSIRQLNTVRERASNKGLAPLLPPIDNAIVSTTPHTGNTLEYRYNLPLIAATW